MTDRTTTTRLAVGQMANISQRAPMSKAPEKRDIQRAAKGAATAATRIAVVTVGRKRVSIPMSVTNRPASLTV